MRGRKRGRIVNITSIGGKVSVPHLLPYSASKFALVGLSASNAEAAQAASFPVMAVLVFASSAFVPVQSMPGWLQAYAEHQPVTATVDAMRALVLGGPTTAKVVAAIAWSVGILVVFAPLAVKRYRRAV